jgi:hypothetical protein
MASLLRTCILAGLLAATLPSSGAGAKRDGARDFDFEIGTWKTHVSRRVGVLKGSDKWVEYDGTSVVRRIWESNANLVELDVRGPSGRIEALSLRLYDADSGQWTLHVATRAGGSMSPPLSGGFKDGRGEFYGQETIGGRAVLVRFVISEVSTDLCRFEQAFSDDGGKSWETNWVAVDTRVRG